MIVMVNTQFENLTGRRISNLVGRGLKTHVLPLRRLGNYVTCTTPTHRSVINNLVTIFIIKHVSLLFLL
jgi:hypothetical protein